MNNLISMTKLTAISMGYQQANTDFYGSTIGMEILCLAVFTPILEELVFRGILFGRLKDMLSKPFAVGISALIFAAVHVYRAVHLRIDSWCGAGTSDGSCGKCLCIHDRTYDGKFYCSCADGNALAGFQRQGRCGLMDIFSGGTGSRDCADVEVFV